MGKRGGPNWPSEIGFPWSGQKKSSSKNGFLASTLPRAKATLLVLLLRNLIWKAYKASEKKLKKKLTCLLIKQRFEAKINWLISDAII